MAESFGNLMHGFTIALTMDNLIFGFLGCLLGTLIGVLPGIGPTSGIAMLLPLTTVLEPTSAIIMLAGLYYGAMYGGSTTAILVNIPGEVSSVPTALDGYKMALKGKAGLALSMAAISSFFAGTLSLVGLTFFAPSLAKVSLRFGPPEYFALMVLALSVVVNLSGRSLLKGLISGLLGFLIASIGMDPMTGVARFSYGNLNLMSGIDFISVIIGLFAISEILGNAGSNMTTVFNERIEGLWPKPRELIYALPTMIRSTVIGFFMGLLPGCSPAVTSFIAYDTEKRLSKNPENFGRGELLGIVAPEGANNATTSGGFVPLMSFGIPSGPALAVLLGGLMIYGLQPGPTLFEKHGDFVWAVIASMYVGNVILLILNLPLVAIWVKLVRIPYPILAPLVLVFSFLGAFSVRFRLFDVGVALFFGLFGWLLKKTGFPASPLILCLILADLFETSLKQSLSMSQGNPLIFLSRPLSLVLIVLAIILAGFSIYARFRKPELASQAIVESE